ncbi:hypothetical protein [Myxococcus sp. NMCA1]|uniref:hypothetical protein n=1 Tax=Myxococcus sp. NMCA1 TaxID=2996785 RepID=UPI002285A28D|nr:hypothetical protein [Myxococcus sp. NMCA1]WAM28172.1 hypothetical protein OZ403_08585 [Myxococcus sp. NMCA1]
MAQGPHGFHGRPYLGVLIASPPALQVLRQVTTVSPVPAPFHRRPGDVSMSYAPNRFRD